MHFLSKNLVGSSRRSRWWSLPHVPIQNCFSLMYIVYTVTENRLPLESCPRYSASRIMGIRKHPKSQVILYNKMFKTLYALRLPALEAGTDLPRTPTLEWFVVELLSRYCTLFLSNHHWLDSTKVTYVSTSLELLLYTRIIFGKYS